MENERELALRLAVDVGQYRMLPEDRIVEIAERFASFLESPMALAKSADPKAEIPGQDDVYFDPKPVQF